MPRLVVSAEKISITVWRFIHDTRQPVLGPASVSLPEQRPVCTYQLIFRCHNINFKKSGPRMTVMPINKNTLQCRNVLIMFQLLSGQFHEY